MTPLKFSIYLAAFYFIIICGVIIYLFTKVASGLPSLEQLENPRTNYATQIISADGKLLDHFFIQRRVNLPFDSIPKDFINALISVEDRSFYSHWGVNTYRIFGAAFANITSMKTKQGASTITMQLSRNLFFNQENTLKRKLQEAVTAAMIEERFSKNEILQMYTNTVNFGRGAFGLQVASKVYFDKSPMQLTTAECAFLVGILKAPEHYNGLANYEKALTRRNLVLALMNDAGFLTDAQKAQAQKEPINLAKLKSRITTTSYAPHFVEMIRQQITKDLSIKDLDLYRDGLIINTTLDLRIQKYAEEAVEEHLSKFQETFNKGWSWSRKSDLLKTILDLAVKDNPEYHSANAQKKKEIEERLLASKEFVDSVKNAATTVQCGVVVLDVHTGAILAMVGASPKFMNESPDAKYSLNHVTQIKRQPGSSFKPFVYSCALMEGLTPESQIECGPYTYTLPSGETWSPRGTGKCSESGHYSLYTGLCQSVNTMSARLITQVTTPQKVIDLARRMGIESPLQAVPALSLGAGGEVEPLEMASAFGVFPNEGVHVKPYYVNSIEDQFGNVFYEKKRASESSQALEPRIARQMCQMMKGVVQHGTAWTIAPLVANIDAAGKTGTTNDFKDAWFVGYTPQLVAAVWVGFDNNRIAFTGGYGYAATAAAPIWGLMMKKIYADPLLPYKQKRFMFGGDSTLETLVKEKDDDIYSKTDANHDDESPKQAPSFEPLNNPQPREATNNTKKEKKKVEMPALNEVNNNPKDAKKKK